MTFDPVTSAQKFITAYREIEAGDPKLTDDIILYLEKHKSTAEHLCDSWRGRKQDWGDFYLNLSHAFQYKILRFWGMADPAGEQYFKQVEAKPMAMMWADLPDCIMWPHELLKFFYNHGISEIPEPGIILSTLPPFDQSYGNSANWGAYVLSLPEAEQSKLLLQLYDHIKEKLEKYN